MPLDPLAKRFLAMIAAASPRERSPISVRDRRQSLAKIMELARGEAAEIARIDGVLPGPAGNVPYGLLCPPP